MDQNWGGAIPTSIGSEGSQPSSTTITSTVVQKTTDVIYGIGGVFSSVGSSAAGLVGYG